MFDHLFFIAQKDGLFYDKKQDKFVFKEEVQASMLTIEELEGLKKQDNTIKFHFHEDT
jgi:hypothetical protein